MEEMKGNRIGKDKNEESSRMKDDLQLFSSDIFDCFQYRMLHTNFHWMYGCCLFQFIRYSLFVCVDIRFYRFISYFCNCCCYQLPFMEISLCSISYFAFRFFMRKFCVYLHIQCWYFFRTNDRLIFSAFSFSSLFLWKKMRHAML